MYLSAEVLVSPGGILYASKTTPQGHFVRDPIRVSFPEMENSKQENLKTFRVLRKYLKNH